MSCRAMGFGLELAVLHDIMGADGEGTWTGIFVPSERNAPAADLFERAQFVRTGEGRWQTSDRPGGGPDVPAWLAGK